MVDSRVVKSQRGRDLPGTMIKVTLDVRKRPSDFDLDVTTLNLRSFQTPHRTQDDRRTSADTSRISSPPRLARTGRSNELNDLKETNPSSVPHSAFPLDHKLELDLSPIRSLSFEDDEFILALPSEIGMVSRDSSLAEDPQDHLDSEFISKTLDDELWGESVVMSTASLRLDSSSSDSFRPISDDELDMAADDEEAFDLPSKRPRTGFRLMPRRARIFLADASL